MNPDENWKETKATANDLSKLLGIPESSTIEFLEVLENLIIHRLVESLLTEDKISDKDFLVELPYLGSIVVSLTGARDRVSISFVPRNTFYRKIRKACHTLESPLNDQVSFILGSSLSKLFEEGGFSRE